VADIAAGLATGAGGAFVDSAKLIAQEAAVLDYEPIRDARQDLYAVALPSAEVCIVHRAADHGSVDTPASTPIPLDPLAWLLLPTNEPPMNLVPACAFARTTPDDLQFLKSRPMSITAAQYRHAAAG